MSPVCGADLELAVEISDALRCTEIFEFHAQRQAFDECFGGVVF